MSPTSVRLVACSTCGEPTLPEYDQCCCCEGRCSLFPKVPKAFLEALPLLPADATDSPPLEPASQTASVKYAAVSGRTA